MAQQARLSLSDAHSRQGAQPLVLCKHNRWFCANTISAKSRSCAGGCDGFRVLPCLCASGHPCANACVCCCLLVPPTPPLPAPPPPHQVISMIKSSALCGSAIIAYLQAKGYPEVRHCWRTQRPVNWCLLCICSLCFFIVCRILQPLRSRTLRECCCQL